MLMKGESTAPDYRDLVVDLAEDLIKRGIPQGYYDMGYLLSSGYGVKHDPNAALIYFRKAADLGNPEAQYHIGEKLHQTSKAYSEPWEIGNQMKRCAGEQGHAIAAEESAIDIRQEVLFHQKGTYAEAVKYFQLAIKAGAETLTLAEAFNDPPPDNQLYYLALEKDEERSRRYEVLSDILGRYSYLNPTVDEIDEIVPLPPAPLPDWDGQIQFQKEWDSDIPPPLPSEERIAEMAREKGLDPFSGRPMKPQAEAEPEPPPAPKPLYEASTGAPCPITGLWRCENTGEKRVLAEGQPMPETSFTQAATGWLDRLRGRNLKFSHMGPGLWKWKGPTPENGKAVES
jgi:tetratricopeptide (TPR) repeat protein